MRIPAQSVCTAIRDDIVSGVFERGSRLTEELLARRYGVSRVPVREALRTLESEGFVVTRRHAGACVAEPTEQEAADLLEVRMLLEPLGAARAAQRRTEAHLKVLRGLVRLGQERARRGEGEDLRSLGGWFHETLAQASASPGLIALLTQLRHKIAWMYAVEQPARPADSWAEHGAIVDAVARGDAERARALAAQHAERATAVHRLRRAGGAPGRDARAPRSGGRVRTSQHAVNTASGRH
ncbi:GntR family transcriptional regulator [Streptomyces sp. NBC_01320]|uniref:GntR family transcriptional regulator n=1 Tax=Streptomyces sp. NBC_01320 TaxID=2903824 RepID=UPI002E132DBD|nr:GntR family transcriptional regulator [Streptomyces sp. NBC_01320]